MTILDSPENTTANFTTTVIFSYLVEGSHVVVLTWRNGSEPVMDDRPRVAIDHERVNRTFSRSTLTIRSVDVSDTALYSCDVENSLPLNISYSSSADHQFSLYVQSEFPV